MADKTDTVIEAGSNAEWYVRAAVHRGIAAVRHTVEDADRIIKTYEADTSLAMRGTVLEMTRNMQAYNQQLLREMEQYIPEALRPQ